jgi:hypothetical protein
MSTLLEAKNTLITLILQRLSQMIRGEHPLELEEKRRIVEGA